MHPWYGVNGTTARREREIDFWEWHSNNPDSTLKRGNLGGDGRIFVKYAVTCVNGEHWADAGQFEKIVISNRKQAAKVRSRPGQKEKYNEYMRNRYARDDSLRRKILNRALRWAAHNPDKVVIKVMRRNAIKKSAFHPDIDLRAEIELRTLARLETSRTGSPHEVDHIIPLDAGGWHHHQNMQVIPKNINCQKNSDPFWTSPVHKDWRSVPSWLWPEHLVCAYLERLYDDWQSAA